MKVEMLTDKSKDEIASIWTEHFAAKDAVCAVIPASVFKEMKKLYNIHKTVSVCFYKSTIHRRQNHSNHIFANISPGINF